MLPRPTGSWTLERAAPSSLFEREPESHKHHSPRHLDKGDPMSAAEIGGTVPLWHWIGDDNAVTFSY
jgi:hypothetical protein